MQKYGLEKFQAESFFKFDLRTFIFFKLVQVLRQVLLMTNPTDIPK